MRISNPFKRAHAMMAIIQAALASANPQLALAGIPAYQSRGKGKSRPFVKSWASWSQRRRNGGPKPPINGYYECARRVRQMGGV